MDTNKPGKLYQNSQISHNPVLQEKSWGIRDDISSQVNNTLDKTIILSPHETVIKGVFYVRHGATNDESGSDSNSAQSPYALLNNKGKSEVYKAISRLKDLGVKKEDICIYYSPDTVRIEHTLEIFRKEFGLSDNQYTKDDRLRSTRKLEDIDGTTIHLPKNELYAEILGISAEVSRLMNDIKKMNKKYIILLGHKTNKVGAEGIADFNGVDIGGNLYMPTGGILTFDVNKEGEYISYDNHYLLSVNSENYSALKLLFPDSSLGVGIDFQNNLNALFKNIQELYGKYLIYDNSPVGLKAFCLANLIKSQEYSSIEEYYLSTCTTLSIQEKELFLQNTTDPKMQLILRKLFVTKEKLWMDTDSNLFETEFYNLLKSSRTAYNTAKSLQGNSLDLMINKCENGAILDRKLYFEEKQKSEESKNSDRKESQEMEILVQRNFDQKMFQKGGKYTRFIIRAHVGEGKSMYLSELVKNFSLEQENNVTFVVAKNIKDVEALFTPNNPETFICIDALDEASDEIKKAIKAQMRTFKGRIIITARYSEPFDPDEKICALYFNPLESDAYLDSRFVGNEKKATEVKEWLKKHRLAAEVKGNPLLLNLIVLLASATEKDKEWMDKYGISEYFEIKTKSDLYENAVRFVLTKHKGNIKNKTMLEMCMNRLMQHAFDIFSNNKKPDIDKEFFDENLSFLAKKTEDYDYEFIHKSFYEFFLARHLACKDFEVGEKLKDAQECLINSWWGENNVMLFYTQWLAKSKKWKEFELILQNDACHRNYFYWLEILESLGIYEILEKNEKNDRGFQVIHENFLKYTQTLNSWTVYKILVDGMLGFWLYSARDGFYLTYLMNHLIKTSGDHDTLLDTLDAINTPNAFQIRKLVIGKIVQDKNFTESSIIYKNLSSEYGKSKLVTQFIDLSIGYNIKERTYHNLYTIIESFIEQKQYRNTLSIIRLAIEAESFDISYNNFYFIEFIIDTIDIIVGNGYIYGVMDLYALINNLLKES